MRLIPFRVLWAFWSVKAMLAAALVGLAAGLFAYMDEIPPLWFLVLQVALPVAAIIVRAIKQPKLDQ
jgi:hypothetical protein